MVSRSVPRRSVAPVFPFPAPSPPYPHPTNTRRLEITETLGIGRIEQGRIKRAARNGSNRAQAGFGAYFSSIGVRKFHVTFRGSPLRIPSNFHFSSPPHLPAAPANTRFPETVETRRTCRSNGGRGIEKIGRWRRRKSGFGVVTPTIWRPLPAPWGSVDSRCVYLPISTPLPIEAENSDTQ